MWPRAWGIKPPLNTRPTNPSAGAYYKVLFFSPTGNRRTISADGNDTAEAYFVTPWNDHTQFEVDALGSSFYVAGQNRFNRHLPMAHGDPSYQNFDLNKLTTISHHNFDKKFHEAMGTSEGMFSAGWPKTQMVAYRGDFLQHSYFLYSDTYVNALTIPELKRYVFKFSETESYHRKIPGYGFAFASDPTKFCTVLASLPEFMCRWIYTTYQWPYPDSIPQDYIDRTLGTVNDATFDTDQTFTLDDGSTQTGFEAEELKYENCIKSKPYWGADNRQYVDIQHIFLRNPNNWNKQVNPDGNYEYIQQLGPGRTFLPGPVYPFKKRNFDKLFKPRGAT